MIYRLDILYHNLLDLSRLAKASYFVVGENSPRCAIPSLQIERAMRTIRIVIPSVAQFRDRPDMF